MLALDFDFVFVLQYVLRVMHIEFKMCFRY